jgi:hypothetical protein
MMFAGPGHSKKDMDRRERERGGVQNRKELAKTKFWREKKTFGGRWNFVRGKYWIARNVIGGIGTRIETGRTWFAR